MIRPEPTFILKESVVLPFKGIEDVGVSFSQAAQDIFVLSCLDGKRNGKFIDLGCSYPILINNTFLLESVFNWNGISVDRDKNATGQYPGTRRSLVYNLDCTNLDFEYLLKYENAIGNNSTYEPHHFDYLSIDLDPAPNSLKCLLSIPFEKVKFSLITFEHDCYGAGDYVKSESRKHLESYGYKRICSNVSNEGNPYEDWYYNPARVDYERIKVLESDSKEWREILFKK